MTDGQRIHIMTDLEAVLLAKLEEQQSLLEDDSNNDYVNGTVDILEWVLAQAYELE